MARPAWRWLVLVPILVIGRMLYGEDFSPTVVASPSVVVDALSRNELRAIFFMRRRTWPDGTPIQVFVLPDDRPLHQAFCKQILNVYPHQLRRAWDRGVFSGTGQAPIEVETIEEMQEKVASSQGAIGYIGRDHLDASVKAVTVR